MPVSSMDSEKRLSSLELVSRVDSWPYFSRDPEAYNKRMTNYYYFVTEGFAKPFGYVHSDFFGEMTLSRVCSQYWVPRRSKKKMSYPGKFDNTVGGSLASGKKAINCMVRGSAEEASLPESYIRANLKSCGALSYQMSRTDAGKPGCQHQVHLLYELELPQDMVPKPCDGEVEEFSLTILAEVQDALAVGESKWNCAMTWMAYFIRHGIVNAENEPNLEENCSRLHRKLDIFVM